MAKTKSKKPFFKKNSRMKHFEIIFDESIDQNRVAFYKFNVTKRLGKAADDQIYTVTKGMEYRMDLISIQFYGSAAYDWVLAEYNNIEDPIKDIVAGKKLLIPSKSKLGSI